MKNRLAAKRTILVSLLLILAVDGFGESKRVLINTGHNGEITAIEYQERYNLLFTSGADGTVRAWDPETRGLVYLLQVSHYPIMGLALNPELPEVAILESDGTGAFKLSVWDWQKRKPVFSTDLSELPLFLMYSPKGTFIIYGTTDWNGLVMMDGKSGTRIPVLKNAAGIVSCAYVSASENTILTYSPSGYLKYWDIRTGGQKAEIATLSNLSDPSFTTNGRYMIGISEGDLTIVDLVTGKPTIVRHETKKYRRVSLYGDSFISLTTGRSQQLELWSLQNGGINFSTILSVLGREQTNGILLSRGTAYWSLPSGEVRTQAPGESSSRTFCANTLLPISDIAVGEESLLLMSPDSVVICTSDFFSGSETPTFFTAESQPNPGAGALSLRALEDDHFLAWEADSDSGPLYLFTPNDNLYSQLGTHERPIVDLECAADSYLLLDSSGTIELRKYGAESPDFTFSYSGLRDICFAGSMLMAAGNSASLLSSPLLQINPRTGETVPIPDSNILTFRLRYDETRNRLYSLGFEKRNDSLYTVLKSASGPGYDRGIARISYPGEDADADIVIDSATGILYTSLGYGRVRSLSWTGFTDLEASDHVPRRLAVKGNWIFALNMDKSITVWDTRSGKRIMDLYIFNNVEWVALFASGEFYSSTDGERYVSVFNEEEMHTEDTTQFKRSKDF